MIKNKYLDPTAQKAYINGVNGCVEHITIVQEIIQDTYHNKKSCNFTWFDLQDAFGSLSHDLIICHAILSNPEKNNHIYNKPLFQVGR